MENRFSVNSTNPLLFVCMYTISMLSFEFAKEFLKKNTLCSSISYSSDDGRVTGHCLQFSHVFVLPRRTKQ